MYVSFDEQRVNLNLYIYGNGFSKSLGRQSQSEMSAWGIELTICGEGVLRSPRHTLNSIKIRALNLWMVVLKCSRWAPRGSAPFVSGSGLWRSGGYEINQFQTAAKCLFHSHCLRSAQRTFPVCDADSRLNVGTDAGTQLNSITPDSKEIRKHTASLLSALTEGVKVPPTTKTCLRVMGLLFSDELIFFFNLSNASLHLCVLSPRL